MSQTNGLFTNLFNLKHHNKSVVLSTQELYTYYSIFQKLNKKLNFSQFCTLFYIFISTNKVKTKTSLVLAFFFLFKTLPLLKVEVVKNSTGLATDNIFSLRDFNFSNRLNHFWKKFKKLKRPTTEENFNEYFLSTWEKKLTIYKNLNLIKTIEVFYLVRSKSEEFIQTLISVNKPLLLSPKFSSTSINKFLKVEQLNNFEFQFLRKNKVYNKGRYSRCRQNYRTGVYMCMYLSVCAIFGLYYWFYKFSFNFTYLWWLFIAFVASFFLPKIVKYRLYEPTTLVNKFFDFFKWLVALVRSIFF